MCSVQAQTLDRNADTCLWHCCRPQANFRAEVLLLRMCRNPNVVGFRGASVTAKRMLMVMEVCRFNFRALQCAAM